VRRVGKLGRYVVWLWRCRCGREVEATARHVVAGKRRYCDRMNHVDVSPLGRVADPSLPYRAHRPTWVCWNAMKSRCLYESNSRGWKNYGGRGIVVCERWMADFRWFVEDMGMRPSRAHSIERRNVNGNYEPGNCYWATRAEQGANRRDTVWVEYQGERVKLVELCRSLGVDGRLVGPRIRMGWALDRALVPREVDPLREKARLAGLPYDTVRDRVRHWGWSEKRALTTPIRVQQRRKRCMIVLEDGSMGW
jgi:hypothetical protein